MLFYKVFFNQFLKIHGCCFTFDVEHECCYFVSDSFMYLKPV